MRSLNFRDNVLWAVCYKLGLNPKPPDGNLLDDQAAALGSYINAWVRRLWPAADWPEWTMVAAFVPISHIVPYTLLASAGMDPTELGHVFKVYLVDPRITPGDGLDTRHRLMDTGIHVGYEHGPNVWIKYQAPPPAFTTEEWRPDHIYAKGELTYSSLSGECYKSKINNNRGHQPSVEAFSDTGRGLSMEVTQEAIPDGPGQGELPQILRIYFGNVNPGPNPVDPPPNLSVFGVEIVDASGANLASASDAGNGVKSIAVIMNNIRTALLADPDLAGFTILNDGTNRTMDVQHPSNFGTFPTATAYVQPPPDNTVTHFLKTLQVQPWIPGLAAAGGNDQVLTINLTDDDVVAGATYSLDFRGEDGVVHSASYQAADTDTRPQIIAGILAAIRTNAVGDAFFDTLFTSATDTSIGIRTARRTSVDPTVRRPPPTPAPPGSPYWTMVQFPAALVEPTVRGTYADALKEGGQSEKAAPEEQAVPTETQVQISKFAPQQFDQLTDQETARTRYAVK